MALDGINTIAFPLNLVDYAYNAQDLMHFFVARKSGVLELGDNLKVNAGDGMNITVNTGYGWLSYQIIYGLSFWLDAVQTLAVDIGDGLNDRIDRVCISWETKLAKNLPVLRIKKGTPSETPEPPALENSADLIEICLAELYVPKACTSIANVTITDTRDDESLCGLMTDNHSINEQKDRIDKIMDGTTPVPKAENADNSELSQKLGSDTDNYTKQNLDTKFEELNSNLTAYKASSFISSKKITTSSVLTEIPADCTKILFIGCGGGGGGGYSDEQKEDNGTSYQCGGGGGGGGGFGCSGAPGGAGEKQGNTVSTNGGSGGSGDLRFFYYNSQMTLNVTIGAGGAGSTSRLNAGSCGGFSTINITGVDIVYTISHELYSPKPASGGTGGKGGQTNSYGTAGNNGNSITYNNVTYSGGGGGGGGGVDSIYAGGTPGGGSGGNGKNFAKVGLDNTGGGGGGGGRSIIYHKPNGANGANGGSGYAVVFFFK